MRKLQLLKKLEIQSFFTLDLLEDEDDIKAILVENQQRLYHCCKV